MSRCRKCLLPAQVPGADLDASGVCAFCRALPNADTASEDAKRRRYAADLEQALRDCRGKAEYDCLAMLSGGKDSCWLLHKLKVEYKLNVLAFTVNVNVPNVAWDNIRRTVKKLDVPHVVYTPPTAFYHKFFRYLLQHQESRGAVRSVCYVCAPLTESYALRLATEKKIPLILAGYSPGQPEPERMEYEFSREMLRHRDWTPPELRDSGIFSEEELSAFWNPRRYSAGTRFPRYLAPFHAWEYNQAEVMKHVVQEGLIRNGKHASPIHSNCPINWLLMYSDLRNLGYNSYAPEFSALIRKGKASRAYWRIMYPVVDFMIRKKILMGRNVTASLRRFDLKPEDLRITRCAACAHCAEPKNQSRLPAAEQVAEELYEPALKG